jgi:hypothetical protein
MAIVQMVVNHTEASSKFPGIDRFILIEFIISPSALFLFTVDAPLKYLSHATPQRRYVFFFSSNLAFSYSFVAPSRRCVRLNDFMPPENAPQRHE